MNGNKPRKACVICYQKKVRCDWTEASPVCSYCLNHGLDCLLPSPAHPPQRMAVKDRFAEIDARLRRLEEESRNSIDSSSGPGPNAQKSQHSSVRVASVGEKPSLVSQERTLSDDLDNLMPSRPEGSDRNVSIPSDLSDHHSTVDVPSPAAEIQPEFVAPLSEDDPPGWDVQGFSGESRPSVRRFRGEATPWNVLLDGTASSTLADGPFDKTVVRLADEEISTRPAIGNIYFDFLIECSLTKDLILDYSSRYASEAPFQITCWTVLQKTIERGVTTKRWAHWGEVVCVLLYVAFGAAHLKLTIPEHDSEIYFKKAWGALPHLLMEQDLWALKGLTLMVHYLQGGALPEPCYTLLGSASRMAISLGFHRKHNDKIYSSIEEEEGKRCWWLCYIMERTFSLVLGRPGINLDEFDAEIPRPFSSLNESMSIFTLRDGHLVKNTNANDEESVAFYIDLIEVVRTRDRVTKGQATGNASALTDSGYSSKYETLAEILSYWRMKSQLHRPLDFDISTQRTLRATIVDLCYYNSIISLDRHTNKKSEKRSSNESIQAARASISIIAGSGENGMTMCIWMWMYYGFSSAVVLFLDVIQNPLHHEAMLNLALISDLESLCRPLASSSPGAKRVMDVSHHMNKVAFEVIKVRAKRKAQDPLEMTNMEQSPPKQRRIDDPQGSMLGGLADRPTTEVSDGHSSLGSVHTRGDDHPFSPFPVNFSWDDWDQWLNNTAI